MGNKRIFVRKKEGFLNIDNKLLNEFITVLNLKNLKALEYYVIYDLFDISDDEYQKAQKLVFSETTSDLLMEELNLENEVFLAVELLINQFDQRADSAKECLFLINPQTKCQITSGELIVLKGISEQDLNKVKNYYINPIEKQEKDLSLFTRKTLQVDMSEEVIDDFNNLTKKGLEHIKDKYCLGLSSDNLKFCQEYFVKENRNPKVCELRVLDTYWSDHCRHTTFNTILDNLDIKDLDVKLAFDEYLEMKKEISPNKEISFMDVATIYGRYANKYKIRDNIEDTIEDNAISLILKEQDTEYLYLFKNETHNHPTEIEPFGGASTCIGGAIRDPLSSRADVYQGMRISAGADVNQNLEDTIDAKLPQRIISQKSAHGFSSYGNQIGIATSFVKELYHPGYLAKHFEAGAVVGACKRENIIRLTPQKGDLILLIGGKTGYDGIGGATGSSKSHNEKSLENSAIEVQKGNALEERKILRLFRNPKATKMIKKCNDFGAGGVSVAIGELADSIEVYLDKVPLKTAKLKPSDIALSESQERMAVVIESDMVDEFIMYCHEENLEATVVAKVTDNNRLTMYFKGQVIIDLARDFIATNGVDIYQNVVIDKLSDYQNNNYQDLKEVLKNPNLIDNKNMDMMFDSTVGGKTVLMPYGGKYQETKNQVSVHRIPNTKRLTSHIAYGFNPYLMEQNTFIGAQMAIVDSVTKLVTSGVSLQNINLSFQEYFNSLKEDDRKWGEVLSALLGAFKAQKNLQIPALGGKDSMSGTFNNINVPPTLVSFAFGYSDIDKVISGEAKAESEYIYIVDNSEFAYDKYLKAIDNFDKLVCKGEVTSAFAISDNGIALAISKMMMGNKLGCKIKTDKELYAPSYGSIIFTSKNKHEFECLGRTNASKKIHINDNVHDIEELIRINNTYFENIYPPLKETKTLDKKIKKKEVKREYSPLKTNNPNVLIMVFSGTNSEVEMEKAFKDQGCVVNTLVFKNLNKEMIGKSVQEYVSAIEKAHIIAIPGGFSGGDEPDGSGKYIVSVLQNEKIKTAIHRHLDEDKLILGICNGFQALIKSGLITHGRIQDVEPNEPTLFANDCMHHISKVVETSVQTKNSPWLKDVDSTKVYSQVISHGEGKIVVDSRLAEKLFEDDQVAFCYEGLNPNGSMYDIEGLLSPCGKVLGKMAHSERYDDGLYQNIVGNKRINIFESSVKYFKGE